MKNIRCAKVFNITERANYCTHNAIAHQKNRPKLSNTFDYDVDVDKSSTAHDTDSQPSIGSVLQKIVNGVRIMKSPLSAFSESSDNNSVWKGMFDHTVIFEPKPTISFSDWIEYTELLAPVSQSKESEFAIKHIVQILNDNQDALLHDIRTRLSVPDVVEVLLGLQESSAAFTFYEWVRRQSFYVPCKSIYTTLIKRLIASVDSNSWDRLHVIVHDMVETKVFINNRLLRKLLFVAEEFGLRHPCSAPRMQRYVDWLLRMNEAGFIVWVATYKLVMKKCNLLKLYESTVALFWKIPLNTYPWTLTIAVYACKGMKDVRLAEELVGKMTRKRVKPTAKCLNVLLTLCADEGQAAKAYMYLNQLKNAGFLVDERVYPSIIHAYGNVGWVDKAEDLFKSLKGKLNSEIYGAMVACYRSAGHLDKLLPLFKEAQGSLVDAAWFTLAFEACVEKSEWQIAVEIIKVMKARDLVPEPRLCRAILLACSNVCDYSACEGLFFDVSNMGLSSAEEVLSFINMALCTGKGSLALDALELCEDPQFDTDFVDQCIHASFETSLPNALEVYKRLRSMGHTPSASVFSFLIQAHMRAGDPLQSMKLYDDMRGAGLAR